MSVIYYERPTPQGTSQGARTRRDVMPPKMPYNPPRIRSLRHHSVSCLLLLLLLLLSVHYIPLQMKRCGNRELYHTAWTVADQLPPMLLKAWLHIEHSGDGSATALKHVCNFYEFYVSNVAEETVKGRPQLQL